MKIKIMGQTEKKKLNVLDFYKKQESGEEIQQEELETVVKRFNELTDAHI